MNCRECGGVYEARSDFLEIPDSYIGKIRIRGVPYYQCENCHDILYTEEMSRAIDATRNRRIHETLNRLPLGDFVSSAEAASILNISRQALHKNRRINHGFIYQTKFAGVTVYLRQSVLQFKETGDGRFPLHRYSHSTEYLRGIVAFRVSAPYELHTIQIKPTSRFVQQRRVSPKEYSYAN